MQPGSVPHSCWWQRQRPRLAGWWESSPACPHRAACEGTPALGSQSPSPFPLKFFAEPGL